MIFFMLLLMIMLIFMMNFESLHPLVIGSLMLSISIIVSLMMNMFNKTGIYSMIMYLIVIGGFLILFLYFNSFIMNEKMLVLSMINIKMFIYKFFLLVMCLMLMIYKVNYYNYFIFMNEKMLEFKSLMNMIWAGNNQSLIKIYLKLEMLVLMGIIYLFYVLVIIVKMIFYYNPKTLRKMV
uniref:NADH dehydrogenase subunit 6 n=1 Tax=Ganaspini sp. ZJUH 20220007 TaxID=2943474 RepID=A0A9E8G7A9_9HYME|nr:NADH dehydrogenase subunit 6 [Ganaspini sp. ZJUH 20220007]